MRLYNVLEETPLTFRGTSLVNVSTMKLANMIEDVQFRG